MEKFANPKLLRTLQVQDIDKADFLTHYAEQAKHEDLQELLKFYKEPNGASKTQLENNSE